VVERDGLQPGEPLAAVGAAKADRQLVADQLAATLGEDGRQADQARAVLLVDAGRELSDQATVRNHRTADRCADGGDGVDGGKWDSEISLTRT